MSDVRTLGQVRITNPLDELFNTLPNDLDEADGYVGVTEGEYAVAQGNDGTAVVEKDDEDIEIDRKVDEVYEAAIGAFNTQTAYLEVIEPRYAARNAEVAANYLNIALNAASVRAKVKGDRKKNAAFVPFSNNKTSGAVVASREDLLRMMATDAELK
jgi:hypothetical protein